METVIERIGGRNKVVVKHNHQAFILQCAEADVEYFKHCFDVMIDCFRKECEGKNESTELSNCNKPAVIGSLPSDKLYCEGDLFAAYLTGQQDVRDRSDGLDGRTFTAWLAENFPRQ